MPTVISSRKGCDLKENDPVRMFCDTGSCNNLRIFATLLDCEKDEGALTCAKAKYNARVAKT